jgi:hypothetical protein
LIFGLVIPGNGKARRAQAARGDRKNSTVTPQPRAGQTAQFGQSGRAGHGLRVPFGFQFHRHFDSTLADLFKAIFGGRG